MKAETLTSIHQALSRFKEGTYGPCSECGDDIALLWSRAAVRRALQEQRTGPRDGPAARTHPRSGRE